MQGQSPQPQLRASGLCTCWWSFCPRGKPVCSDLTMFGHGGSTQLGLKTASLETNWETKLPAKA